MSLTHSPRVVTDGLVLALDAANKKSFDPRENLYPHSETLQTLSNSRCSREVFTSGGPFETGYREFTVTEASLSNIYNFDGGNTISLIAGQIITFSAYFQNVSLTGEIFLRCWPGSGRAWTMQRQVQFNLTTITSTPSTGIILRHSVSLENNGWYRLSMTIQADQNGFSAISINVGGQIGEKYRTTAVQVSNGYALTNYLSTNGSAIQRTTSIKNLSGISNGTMHGGLSFDNLNLGEFIFEGTDDFVTVPQTVLSSTGSSVSAWVYIDDFLTGKSSTGRTFIRGNNNFTSMLAFYNGGYGFETNTNSNPHELAGRTTGNVLSSAIVAGSWFNFALVFNNGTFTGYVNGIQTGSAAITNNLTFNRVGDATGFATNYPAFFKGKISNLKIYNRALSAEEVQQNFNALRSRYGV